MYLPRSPVDDPRFLLWISPVDDRNIPVDEQFIEAARRIGRDFLRYRARELNDESRALELAERAVHLASRARKKKPVVDPVAYLFRTFSKLVDAELERLGRFLFCIDDFLWVSESKTEKELEKTILRREILESVNETTRTVLNRLFAGFTVTEIAQEMGISPATLSRRLSRARKKLKERLDPDRSRAGRSRIDETRKRSRDSH